MNPKFPSSPHTKLLPLPCTVLPALSTYWTWEYRSLCTPVKRNWAWMGRTGGTQCNSSTGLPVPLPPPSNLPGNLAGLPSSLVKICLRSLGGQFLLGFQCLGAYKKHTSGGKTSHGKQRSVCWEGDRPGQRLERNWNANGSPSFVFCPSPLGGLSLPERGTPGGT